MPTMIAIAILCLCGAILSALTGFSGIAVVIPAEAFKVLFFVLLVAAVVTLLLGAFRDDSAT